MRYRLFAFFLVAGPVVAAGPGPCVSGPKVGLRPGPYSAVVSVGPKRGQSHCYICETANRPAVILFARTLNKPLGKLLQGVDKALIDHKKAELRGWVTLLHEDQSEIDPKVVKWAKSLGLRNLPLAVFEDKDGPPTYKLARDADVTILLSVKQKVVHNYAFRTGDLTDAKIAEVLKGVNDLVKK
jgi:hypothetical protein